MKLHPIQEDWAINAILEGKTITEISEHLGFPTIQCFFKYRKRHAEFNDRLTEAREQRCEVIEDNMLNVTKNYKDPRLAEVYIKAAERILRYTKPRVYGDKIDLNVTQTVDISAALERAEARIRDVTPKDQITAANVLALAKKKEE